VDNTPGRDVTCESDFTIEIKRNARPTPSPLTALSAIAGSLLRVVTARALDGRARIRWSAAGDPNVFYLPKYSPDCNPDEKVWNHLKHHELKAHKAKTKEELKALTKTKLKGMSRNPSLLRGLFFRCCVADVLGCHRLDHADWNTRREIIVSLVKSIKIETEQVRITYRINPRPFDGGPARGHFRQHCDRRVFCNTARAKEEGNGFLRTTLSRFASTP
jgi:DDE superfamily endonuclease